MNKRVKSLLSAFGTWVALVGSYGLATTLYQHAQKAKPGTRILVPQGFHGYLVLKWDTAGAPHRSLVGGRYELRFPVSGQLATSDKMSGRPSSLPVSYLYVGASVVPLKYNSWRSDHTPPDNCAPSEFCLRDDGFYGNTEEVYFVGTAADQKATSVQPQL